MSEIKKWRKNAMMTQQEMSNIFEIPKRTIENWEDGQREPAPWAEKLIVEKLMRLTDERLRERARKTANKLKSDENGDRPEIGWCVCETIRGDEFTTRFDSMEKAIEYAKSDRAEGDIQVNLMLFNKGTENWYEDREGDIYADCDGLYEF